eukprot:TRINITY_DN170_c0_g2_i1.p8 TRINITY_DN170_c0_g2~~TRINITY_DN170_c0_g2_i1.p8  ORF type:complete len:161 (+),score=25.41 TRINITY_DN170_c0_g2_i1:907-1389(+)
MNKFLVVFVFCVFGGAVVVGRSLNGKAEVLDVKIDYNSIQTCRLNNCTEVQYVLGDLGAVVKCGWKCSYRGSSTSTGSGGWGWRKLLSSEEGGCVSEEEDADLYFHQQSLRPCCDEFVADKDLESVCEIADRFGLNCDFFKEFNDVQEEYVNRGSVFQVC